MSSCCHSFGGNELFLMDMLKNMTVIKSELIWKVNSHISSNFSVDCPKFKDNKHDLGVPARTTLVSWKWYILLLPKWSGNHLPCGASKSSTDHPFPTVSPRFSPICLLPFPPETLRTAPAPSPPMTTESPGVPGNQKTGGDYPWRIHGILTYIHLAFTIKINRM